MRNQLLFWDEAEGWNFKTPVLENVGLVLYFGAPDLIDSGRPCEELRALFPESAIVGCGTGSVIFGDDVNYGVVATALSFDKTQIRASEVALLDPDAAFNYGAALGDALASPELAAVLFFADVLTMSSVHGSFASGVSAAVGKGVSVIGAYAGDGSRGKKSIVGANAPPGSSKAVAIGFYGSAIHIGCGSASGFDTFGPRRRISLSSGTTIHELDGKPALDLYERYLGDEAALLPNSARFYPMKVWNPKKPDHSVVGIVRQIDRDLGSITFSSAMPEAWYVQMMRGYTDRLVAAAADAAHQALASTSLPATGDQFALLISTGIRRMVLGHGCVDEVTAAADELPPEMSRLGFYSYGQEITDPTTGIGGYHGTAMTVIRFMEIIP